MSSLVEKLDRELNPRSVSAATNNGAPPPPIPFGKGQKSEMTFLQYIAKDTASLAWLEMKAYAAAVIAKYEGDGKPDPIKLADAMALWAADVDVTPK